MRVIRFKVAGLNGNHNRVVDIDLSSELTILTGRNGCGKTSILRMLWYCISPNVERVFKEYDFESIELETDVSLLKLEKKGDTLKACYKNNDVEELVSSEDSAGDSNPPAKAVRIPRSRRGSFLSGLELINDHIRGDSNGSLFFPTYRRIEDNNLEREGALRRFFDIAESIDRHSNELTVGSHRFITAVSTKDITDLLVSHYAQISSAALGLRANTLVEIEQELDTAAAKGIHTDTKDKALERIREIVKHSNDKQEDLFHPINEVENIVKEFVDDKKISFGESLSFGDVEGVVSAGKLSAGEKQILSFLIYNAFFHGVPIIIDEPELSLHVDWQRRLIRALRKQNTDNQLIMATHSPFIYSRYPEFEYQLGESGAEE
jgi:hypothetical protein